MYFSRLNFKKGVLMFKFLLFPLVLIFSINSFATANFDGYQKRFNLVRNEAGNLTYVKMNFFNKKFSLKPYLEQIKSDLMSEIARMRSKSHKDELDEFMASLGEGQEKTQEMQENIFAVRRSLESLDQINVDHVFKELEKGGVLAQFKKELKAALDKYSLAVIASTEDPRYFYKRNVTYEVVKRALDFAKNRFSSVPLLNLASFVIVQVHDLVLEQRLFHQNMLLHYMQNAKESELGMTTAEVDKVFSSIYESRIGAINFRESNQAVANWDKYGLAKFYAMVRVGNNRLRRNPTTLQGLNRYNFGFFEAVIDGERVVKHLAINKHSFSSEMATAYYYSKPDKVRRFRSLLNLGQIGLGFLPIPAWLKNQANSFINSYYVQQKRQEGALIGYFEMNSNTEMVNSIKKQLVNPYILFN